MATTPLLPKSDGIVYSLVSRSTNALVEYAMKPGNFADLSMRIVSQVASAPNNTKKNFAYEGYVFHTLVKDGVCVLCLADQSFGTRLPQAFLQDVHDRFMSAHYTDLQSPDATRDTFARFTAVLRERMDFYSNDRNADKITSVKADLEDTRVVMVQNLDKVLERGEKIESLVDKTAQLDDVSQTFRVRTREVRRAFCRQNWCLTSIIVGITTVVVAVIVVIILWKAGVFKSHHHNDESDDNELLW